jgi:alpha-L-fucosidase
LPMLTMRIVLVSRRVGECGLSKSSTNTLQDATLFDPTFWADIFASAGAQYVVLTSKHHEGTFPRFHSFDIYSPIRQCLTLLYFLGYCMWDSRNISSTWNWNVLDVGPRRDLLGELAASVRKAVSVQTEKPLKFGAYHSLFEW